MLVDFMILKIVNRTFNKFAKSNSEKLLTDVLKKKNT